MAFIFVPLETISYSFRAISLGVRLWVNMLAGHTLLHILTGVCVCVRGGVGGGGNSMSTCIMHFMSSSSMPPSAFCTLHSSLSEA